MANALAAGDVDRGREAPERDGGVVVPAERLVDLLGNEHTREVLEAIADEPMGGREIAEATSLSRPTVYRRLNRLEEAGLVETEMALCEDGHHHKQFRAVLETASLQLGGSGLTADVRIDGAASRGRIDTERPSGADVVGD